MTKHLLRRSFRSSLRSAASWRLVWLALLLSAGSQTAWAFDYALYFAFQAGATLPATPSSILIQSPSFIDVPAGTVLTVNLMKGDLFVAKSTLTFSQAFHSEALIPPVPIASFLPPDATNTSGQPLANATLNAGKADLNAVAQAPAQYRLLWELSEGVMGTPGRAVVTGAPVSFVDLKLCAVSSAKIIGDQKPGSVLFFNRFTSNASNPFREDTLLSLTNTNPTTSTFVRLFLISSATCEIAELTLCLAAQQTASVLMSEIDPGIKGYLIAIATDGMGRPTYFNWLIGQALLRQPAATGTVSSALSAYIVAKRREGTLTPDGSNQAELIFDDVNYDRLPAQLAYDSVPSQLNGTNTTQLSLYRPLANLAGGTVNASVQVTAFGRNAQSQAVTSSGTLPLACFAEVNVNSLRLSPLTIGNLILPGSTAWLAVSTSDLLPLLGAQINTGEFNGGGNARALSFSTEYRIRVPVTAVICPL